MGPLMIILLCLMFTQPFFTDEFSPTIFHWQYINKICNSIFAFHLFSGTGKSETGAHIAYAMAVSNPADKCVLYCGPTNKSVDVVLGM